MMRKLSVVLGFIVVFLGHEGVAQWTKGSFMAGGSVAYNREQIKESVNPDDLDNMLESQLGLSPYIGYFFADKWAGGIAPTYSNIRREGDKLIFNGLADVPYAIESTSDTHALGVFLRRYLPVSEQFTFFMHLQGNAGQTDITNLIFQNGNPISDSETRSRVQSIELRPGIAFFPTKNLSIETYLGLLQWNRIRNRPLQDGTSPGIETNTNINVDLNPVNFNLTLLYFFHRKG
jgi:hypothetical protein